MNKVERVKKLKSGIKFYKNSFALHPPYLILCDSNFLFAAIDSNISLEESFKDVFRGQIYLKVSQCSLAELDGLKGSQFGPTKSFAHTKCQKFKCGHPPKKPNQCILQALRQGFAGSVATQDQELRRKIHRDYPKIPVFFIARQTLQICPPPKSLKEKVHKELVMKYAPKALEREKVGPHEDDKEENNQNDERMNQNDERMNQNDERMNQDDERMNQNDERMNQNENDDEDEREVERNEEKGENETGQNVEQEEMMKNLGEAEDEVPGKKKRHRKHSESNKMDEINENAEPDDENKSHENEANQESEEPRKHRKKRRHQND